MTWGPVMGEAWGEGWDQDLGWGLRSGCFPPKVRVEAPSPSPSLTHTTHTLALTLSHGPHPHPHQVGEEGSPARKASSEGVSVSKFFLPPAGW